MLILKIIILCASKMCFLSKWDLKALKILKSINWTKRNRWLENFVSYFFVSTQYFIFDNFAQRAVKYTVWRIWIDETIKKTTADVSIWQGLTKWIDGNISRDIAFDNCRFDDVSKCIYSKIFYFRGCLVSTVIPITRSELKIMKKTIAINTYP